MGSCIIVDGFNYSKELTSAIHHKGHHCIHVQSALQLDTSIFKQNNYDAHDYLANIIYRGNLDILLTQLNHYEVRFIMPAAISGIPLANLLANKLVLHSHLLPKHPLPQDYIQLMSLMGEEQHQGIHYFINTVSCQSEHFVSAIWRQDGNKLITVDKHDTDPQLIAQYMHKVLNAVGIAYGPSHAEIVFTNYGPMLWSFQPCFAPKHLLKQSLAPNQIELTVDAYMDTDNFFVKTHTDYQHFEAIAEIY